MRISSPPLSIDDEDEGRDPMTEDARLLPHICQKKVCSGSDTRARVSVWQNLHKNDDTDDILAAARERRGIGRMAEVRHAVLETDGTISIVPFSRA